MIVKETTNEIVNKPDRVARVMVEVYKTNDETDINKEQLYVIGLSVRNTINYIELVSMGTVTETLIHPREVFRTAFIKNCTNIIIVHNHPSGDVSPSDEDIFATRELEEAGKLLKVLVLDHVIVSGNKYYSIKAGKEEILK